MDKVVKRGRFGGVASISLEGDGISVLEGEGTEEEPAFWVFHVNEQDIAELVEETFGYGQDMTPRYYGPLKVTIERI